MKSFFLWISGRNVDLCRGMCGFHSCMLLLHDRSTAKPLGWWDQWCSSKLTWMMPVWSIHREAGMSGQPSRLRWFLTKICYKILSKPVGSFWDDTYQKSSCRGTAACMALPRANPQPRGKGGSRSQGTDQGCRCDLWLAAALSPVPRGASCRVARRRSLISAAWVLWTLLASPHNEVSYLRDVPGSPRVRKEVSPRRQMRRTVVREEARGHSQGTSPADNIMVLVLCSLMLLEGCSPKPVSMFRVWESAGEVLTSLRREFGPAKHLAPWILPSSQAVCAHSHDSIFVSSWWPEFNSLQGWALSLVKSLVRGLGYLGILPQANTQLKGLHISDKNTTGTICSVFLSTFICCLVCEYHCFIFLLK